MVLFIVVSEPVGPHPAERDAVLAARSSVEVLSKIST